MSVMLTHPACWCEAALSGSASQAGMAPCSADLLNAFTVGVRGTHFSEAKSTTSVRLLFTPHVTLKTLPIIPANVDGMSDGATEGAQSQSAQLVSCTYALLAPVVRECKSV